MKYNVGVTNTNVLHNPTQQVDDFKIKWSKLFVILTLTVLVTTIDALQHFETG